MAHRALVVGAGLRAREWIAQLNATEGWSVSGVVDPDESAVASALSMMETPRSMGHSSIESGLAAANADVAVIASPAETHVSAASSAMSAGLHVLVEKPLAPSLVEAKELVRLADELGVTAVVGQNYRYMRAHRTARRLVLDGALGRVHLVHANYYRVPHDMTPSLAASGHSILWGMAVHHLDALRAVLGQDAVDVTARISTLLPGVSPEGATLSALITLENGTEVTYSATYESSGHEYFEGGQEFYQRLTGDKATLHMLHRWLILCPKGGLPRVVKRGKREISEEAVLLGRFEAAIRGAEVDCSARENLATMAILEACVRSSQERRTVSVVDLLKRAS